MISLHYVQFLLYTLFTHSEGRGLGTRLCVHLLVVSSLVFDFVLPLQMSYHGIWIVINLFFFVLLGYQVSEKEWPATGMCALIHET